MVLAIVNPINGWANYAIENRVKMSVIIMEFALQMEHVVVL